MPIDPDVQTELDEINNKITNIETTLNDFEVRIANNESLLNQFFFGIQNALANNYTDFNETANT